MEKEKITQEFTKGFNRSSKIMEFKLGVKKLELLNALVINTIIG